MFVSVKNNGDEPIPGLMQVGSSHAAEAERDVTPENLRVSSRGAINGSAGKEGPPSCLQGKKKRRPVYHKGDSVE